MYLKPLALTKLYLQSIYDMYHWIEMLVSISYNQITNISTIPLPPSLELGAQE